MSDPTPGTGRGVGPADGTDDGPPPLPVGATIDTGFALLRRHPGELLVPQAAIHLAVMVAGLVIAAVAFLVIGDVRTVPEELRESRFLGDSVIVTRDIPQYTDGQAATLAAFGLPLAVVVVWGMLGALVSVVRGAHRAIDGEPTPPLRDAVRDALSRVPGLFLLWVAYGLAWIVIWAVVAGAVVAASSASGSLGLLVALALGAGVAWLAVRMSLWPVVHLTERAGLASWRRSLEITRGRFWPLLGVYLLAGLVVLVVYLVVGILAELLLHGAFAVDDIAGFGAIVPYFLIWYLLGLVTVALMIAPLVAAHRTLAGAPGWDAGPSGRRD
ncbi:MAG: hypothetical protein M0P31_04290 [Solirubrobacteraceae bacterium]|nr:hypothetical protein [Solirubrobacteraceae bacterium]